MASLTTKNGTRASPMQAIWRGRVIAESDKTLEVGGYRYFPRETVRMDLLRPAPKTPSDLECPHGVQFYDVGEAAEQSKRAAWSYEAPRFHAADRSLDRLLGRRRDQVIADRERLQRAAGLAGLGRTD